MNTNERYETFEAAGIELPAHARQGNVKVKCPRCTDERKNKHDKSLSVNVTDRIFVCHNCGWGGRLWIPDSLYKSMNPNILTPERPRKTYRKPAPLAVPSLSDAAIKLLKGRGISTTTISRFGITEVKAWMPVGKGATEVPAGERPALAFPYKREGELVNVKYRGLHDKSFRMEQGAELIFFNLDSIATYDYCVVVEGEFDALAVHEAGIVPVVSVPNGASKGTLQLEYLDNCHESFLGKQRIVLATDDDEPGRRLRDELARRFGKDRCYQVSWPAGCKDANDVLLQPGGDVLLKAILDGARPWPIEGIVTDAELESGLDDIWKNGLPRGVRVGYDDFDEHCEFLPGQFIVVTGSPGSGKSNLIDQFIERLAGRHQWPVAIFSPESRKAELQAANIMAKYCGKPFHFGTGRMSEEEFSKGKAFVREYFSFFKVGEQAMGHHAILEKARELVMKRGIKALVIDPWNYLEHQNPGKEGSSSEYIGSVLKDIIHFGLAHEVLIFLIAHPTKLRTDPATGREEPASLYSISGSANFRNMADVGISVYRDRETGVVRVFILKMRFWWLGKEGAVDFEYERGTGRYKESAGQWTSGLWGPDAGQKQPPKQGGPPRWDLPAGVTGVKNFSEPLTNEQDDLSF